MTDAQKMLELSERLLQLANDEGTAQIHDVAIEIAAIAARTASERLAATGEREAWERAFTLSAEAARGMGMAAARANVHGRLSEAYFAVETTIKQIAEAAKRGEKLQDNSGVVCIFPSTPRVSPDYVLVPREPTEAMLSAGDSMMPQIAAGEDITTGYDALKEAWPAMIAAHREAP